MKFRISLIDFIPQLGKFPINQNDAEGSPLHIGDIVKDERGEKHFIGYRYGEYMLKQPHTIHSIMVKDYSHYTRQNEVWAVLPGEWIIIGYDDEALYQKIKDIPDLQLLEANK